MGIETMLIGTAIAGVGSGLIGMKGEHKAIKAEAKAARSQAKLDIAELERQKGEVNQIAQENRSDRIRAADRDVAAFRAGFGFGGGGGSINELRGAMEIDYIEGMDLARIDDNQEGDLASLQASQESVAAGNRDAMKSAQLRRNQATTRFLGTAVNSAMSLGSGLSSANAASAAASSGQGSTSIGG